MRIWLLVLVVVVGCKKNAEKQPPASAPAPVAAPADAHIASDAAAAPDAATVPTPIDGDKLLQTEHVGPLAIGMEEPAVKKALGSPRERTPLAEEAATGLFVSTWTWDGVSLVMGAQQRKGPFKITTITVTMPGYPTARGIEVGAPLAELASTYPRAPESADDPDAFLVGSVYGGLLFKLEKGAVAEIFLGAAAE